MQSKIFFVTGATGDTGSKATQFLLEKGYKVRAFVHTSDERSTKVADLITRLDLPSADGGGKVR